MGGARIDLFKIVAYLKEIEHQDAARGSGSAERFIVCGGDHYTTKSMLALASLLTSQIRLHLGKELPFYREFENHSAHVLECSFWSAVLGKCVSKYKEPLELISADRQRHKPLA